MVSSALVLRYSTCLAKHFKSIFAPSTATATTSVSSKGPFNTPEETLAPLLHTLPANHADDLLEPNPLARAGAPQKSHHSTASLPMVFGIGPLSAILASFAPLAPHQRAVLPLIP